MAEHRAGARECVKFAVFTTGIDIVWKRCDKACVESAPREEGAEFAGIDAREICAEPGGEHFLGKGARIAAPDGENRRHAASSEMLFAVPANVFEEKVAENYVVHPVVARAGHRLAHGLFVGFIRAWRRNRDFNEGQAGGFRLKLQQRLSYGVHGNAFVRAVNCGEEGGNFELAGLTREVKGPGAVFAAAPGEPGFRT